MLVLVEVVYECASVGGGSVQVLVEVVYECASVSGGSVRVS